MPWRKRLLIFSIVNEGYKFNQPWKALLLGWCDRLMSLVLQFSSLAQITVMAPNQQYALCKQIVVPTYCNLKTGLSVSFVCKLRGPKCTLESLFRGIEYCLKPGVTKISKHLLLIPLVTNTYLVM